MISYSKFRGNKTLSSLIFDFHQQHSTKRELSFVESKYILRDIIKNNSYFGYLNNFDDITNFISDVKRNEVEIKSLSFEKDKTDALNEILEKYNSFLKKHNLADLGDIEKFVYENITQKYDTDEFELDGIHFFTSKLQKKILSKITKNIIKETLPINKTQIQTIEAFDEFDEVVKTFKIIRELLDKGENDIKIFTTDIDKYFRIFETLAYEYKIPVFSSKGVELKRYHKGREIAKQKAKLTHSKLTKLGIKLDIQELENELLNETFLYKKGIEITETNQIFIYKNIKHLFLVGTNIDNFPPSREKNIFYTPEFEKLFFKNNLYTSSFAMLDRMKKISQNLYAVHQTDKLSVLIDKNPLNKKFDFNTKKEDYQKEYIKTPFTPKNISVSQINTYNKCPKQYFFKYVLKLKSPTQNKDEMEITLKGKILHKALEITTKEKLNDIDIIIEKAYNDEEIKDELNNDIYETIYKTELKPVIKNFLEYISEIDTSNSEFEYNIYLDENLKITDKENYYLKGVIDRLDIGEKITIIDYKSSTKTSKNNDMLNLKDIQLGLYTYWAKQKFDKETEAYLISFKKEISKFATLKECEDECIKKGRSITAVCYNKEYENKMLNHIKTITKKIKNGEFDYIDEPDCEYCEFEKICKMS